MRPAEQRPFVTGWLLYLRARATTSLAVTLGLSLAVVLAARVTVFEVTLDPLRSPRFTPVWEIVPVAAAVLGPALIAPRLASWELMSGGRLRWRAAVMALSAIVLPAAIPWIAHFRLPEDARWWDISCNVAFFGGFSILVTPWLGRLAGPLTGAALYLIVVALQQLDPALAAHLPVSGAETNLTAHPRASATMVAIAVIAWSTTNGRSRLLDQAQRNS